MPYLDGLDLIRKIRESVPDCQVVIITGHGEFAYAKAAIQLGVADFILKPIDITALCRTLNHIKKELDSSSHKKNEVEKMRIQLQRADAYRLPAANQALYCRPYSQSSSSWNSFPSICRKPPP